MCGHQCRACLQGEDVLHDLEDEQSINLFYPIMGKKRAAAEHLTAQAVRLQRKESNDVVEKSHGANREGSVLQSSAAKLAKCIRGHPGASTARAEFCDWLPLRCTNCRYHVRLHLILLLTNCGIDKT